MDEANVLASQALSDREEGDPPTKFYTLDSGGVTPQGTFCSNSDIFVKYMRKY